MTVKDLIQLEIDIDVYDDVCEALAIAFCGPLNLTDEGLKEFSEVLDYEIEINQHSYGDLPAAIVKVDDKEDSVWKRRLKKAKRFFEAAAGYCACSDYDRWFKEN